MARLVLAALLAVLAHVALVAAQDGLPSYTYKAPIHVECMNRSS